MTITKAILVPFDDEKPVELIDLDNSDYLNITKIVAPDSGIFTRLGSMTFDMYGDDEGLLRNDAGERINARAMQIFAHDTGSTLRDYTSPLVGDWLLTGHPDIEGENTSVNESLLHFPFTWKSARR